MQSEQIKGMLDRAIAVIATWLLTMAVNKGWLSQSDSATLLPAMILLPSLAWGAWVNRRQGLIQSAANTVDPKTGKQPLIITSPEMAAATPGQNNIVSSEDVKVTQK